MIENENSVAPILNDQKRKVFFKSLIQTLVGYSFFPWTGAIEKILNIAFAIPPLFLWLFSMLVPGSYQMILIVSTVVTTIIIWAFLFLKHFLIDKQQNNQNQIQTIKTMIFKLILTPISCFLAFNHFYSTRSVIWISVISFITLLGSLSTIYSMPIRQFGTMTEVNSNLGIRSTKLVRLFVCNILLIIEVIFYFVYSSYSTYVIQVIYCFAFVLWWGGLLADISSTILILFNWINNLVFGEQNKVSHLRAFLTLGVNIVITFALVIQKTSWNYFVIVNSVLMGIAVLSSTSLNTLCCSNSHVQTTKHNYYIQYIIQTLLLAGKIVLTVFIPLVSTNVLLIILGIDIFIYLLISLILNLSKSKTVFGTKQLFYLPMKIKIILKWVLHAIIDICFVFLSHRLFLLQTLNIQSYNFLFRILLYRSYKRSIYQPFSFAIHFSFALAMILHTIVPIWIIPLSMIALPDNPLLLFISPFIIPKKNIHQNQGIYRVLYILISIIGLIVLLISCGFLQPLMLFGLPAFLWSLPLINKPILNGHGKDKSIHQNLMVNLQKVMINFEVGSYILRISKYLVIARVVQKGIGYTITEFRGLQAQQVTSCHGIEAQTIDNMVDDTWGQKSECNFKHLFTSITPLHKEQYLIFQSNQISLVGIIDSRQFSSQLKSNYVKSLLYIMNKQHYVTQYRSELIKVTKELSSLLSQSQLQAFKYPQFMNELGIHSKQCSKIILPPIPQKQTIKIDVKPNIKPKKSQGFFEQFDFMMASSNVKNTMLNDKVDKQQESNINLLNINDSSNNKLNVEINQSSKELFDSKSSHAQEKDIPVSIFQMAITLCIYSLGRSDFIDQKRLYQLLQSQKSAQKILKSVNLLTKGELCNKALRFSFKLTVQQQINGDQTSTLSDIQSLYDTNYYVGVLGEQQFQKAVEQKLELIWSLDYKQRIKLNRYAQRQVDLYLFKLDEFISKSIWNNLRFELLYVTNDDDERYSIQTHPDLLRNIVIEGAVEPFGYAPYYTGYQKIFSL